MKTKPRCSGTWTEARFISFIKGQLRSASRKWGPINEVKKEARVARGRYVCAKCKKQHAPTIKNDKGKRVSNVFIDHRDPIITPEVGFTTWDDFINNLFCEKDNLQLLCRDCHNRKSSEERERARKRNDDIL